MNLTRVAMAWDSGCRSGTLSHGKGRAQRARLEFRRFARSLGPSIGIHSSGWSERRRIHSPLAQRWRRDFACLPRFSPSFSLASSLFFSLTHSISVHGVPQNITRSRHSFFTVDRRREPRDNNGGEERFATAITLTGERGAFLPLLSLLLHSVPFARSPRGWQKSRSGQSLVTFRSRGTDRPRLFLPSVSLPPVLCLLLSLILSLSLYILPHYFVSLHVPSTGRSCSPLLRLAMVPCLPRAFLARSLYTGHPSLSPFTPPPRRLRVSDSKTRSGISLPSRRAPLAVASRRSRLLPL